MTLFNAPRGTYYKWDKLSFMCLGNKQVIAVMAGTEITRGDAPLDLDVEELTEDQFRAEVAKADHKGDWFSMLLEKAALQGFDKEDIVNI